MSARDFRYPGVVPGFSEELMRSKRFRILFATLAVTLLAAVGFSQTVVKAAGPGHHRGGFGPMMGFYADYLDLTDAQKAQMKDIMTKEKPTIQPLMQQLADSHKQLRQLETAGSFDEAKVRAIATQQAQTMTELTVQKARIKSQMMQVLTPDQKDKMAKFEARRQERFQKRFQHGKGQAPATENAPAETAPNQ
jgi:Spy/CpxP family protein refolding chaperone